MMLNEFVKKDKMSIVSCVFIILVLLMSLGSCKGTVEEQKKTVETIIEETMTIVKYGPTTISAGVPFNVQPSGNSAMWVRTSEKLKKTVVIVWNDVELDSAVRDDIITAVVPPAQFSLKGENLIYLLDKDSGITSNTVKILVK